MMSRRLVVFLTILTLLSCSYSYRINVSPPEALIKAEGRVIKSGTIVKSREKVLTLEIESPGYLPYNKVHRAQSYFSPLILDIELEKLKYKVGIDLIEGTSELIIDGQSAGSSPLELELAHGSHILELVRDSYNRQKIELKIDRPHNYLFRHQKEPLPYKAIGIFKCGPQPKQVLFSPDSRYIYIPLLDGEGFQIFDTSSLSIREYIKPSKWAEKRGFVEGLFIKNRNSFWVSQMTSDQIYEYNMLDHSSDRSSLRRTIKTGGKWSKFIAYSAELNLLAVSNWNSSTVSLIDYEKGEVIKSLEGLQTPRGLAFSAGGKYLYITSFNGGLILKYRTSDWKEIGRIYKRGAAMRHIVLSPDGSRCYVSNMAHNELYTIDDKSFKVTKTYKVYYNPNTIDISPDGKRLFISSRGPNSSKGYLKRSPVNGKVTVIDLEKEEILWKIEGGNQPTGLDISPNGNFLVFSNFRDDNIEIYDISVLGTK